MTDIEKTSSPEIGNVEKSLAPIAGADAALKFLRREEVDGTIVDIDEKKLVRKIDWMVMPLMFACYILQYLDKTLINYANVMGLKDDTGTTASQFSYLALAFYVSYCVFEVPQGYLMQRFPTAKYLGLQVILWGICVTMNCACKNFASLVALRVLLGCFESAVAPSLILVTGMWYKKSEQPFRIGIWYLGTGCGTIVGALFSYGFQHYDGKVFRSWQIMFLVCGIITIAAGICVVLFLPDNPMTSRLSHDEKIFAIERLRENKTGVENKTFKVNQAIECIMSPNTWLIILFTASSNVSNGAISSYQATIIKGLGYTSKQTALLSIPSGGVSIVSILSATFVAGRTNSRAFNACALTIPSIIGGALMAFLPKNAGAGKLIGNYMTNTGGAALPLMYSLAAANYAGHTKKITINAILLMSFCVGNIIGPLTFQPDGKNPPQYIPAKIAIMATGAVAVVAALILVTLLWRENRKRDKEESAMGGYDHVIDSEFMDKTDKENPEFRYSY
ncbi:Thiamine pathway transporter [Lachnellula occidentalis]|uniref:Thiamine pathway transporter n=1 Tax=Lachnellula occidentalis TaxID=215460 RepID=A0A8H8S0C3_9HELO|nr:Thiamine pathway transporter [Lachnellula occidentalis]